MSDLIARGMARQPITLSRMAFTPVSGSPGKNLFDKSKTIKGFYASQATGLLVVSAAYYVSDYIAVLPNTTYARTSNTQLPFYDINKNYISGVADYVFTTPVDCYYIRLNCSNLTNLNKEQLELGNAATTYESYRGIVSSESHSNRNVTVGTGKNYATITAALADAVGTIDSPVNIDIYPGTYAEGNITLKDYVNFIGLDKDSVIIDFPGVEGDELNHSVFSGAAICTIANLTAKGTNVKYVHHCDESGNCDVVLDNVLFEKVGDAGGYNQAIGIGLRGNQKYTVKNSEIIGAASETNTKGALFCHNWYSGYSGVTSFCKLQIENSYLHGAPSGLDISSLGSGFSDLLILRGNKLEGALYDVKFDRTTAYSFDQDDWLVLAEGNECANIGQANGALITFTQPVATAVPTVVTI